MVTRPAIAAEICSASSQTVRSQQAASNSLTRSTANSSTYIGSAYGRIRERAKLVYEIVAAVVGDDAPRGYLGYEMVEIGEGSNPVALPPPESP